MGVSFGFVTDGFLLCSRFWSFVNTKLHQANKQLSQAQPAKPSHPRGKEERRDVNFLQVYTSSVESQRNIIIISIYTSNLSAQHRLWTFGHFSQERRSVVEGQLQDSDQTT